MLTKSFSMVAALGALVGCTGTPTVPIARSVSLDRFMGDWYVIASIPLGPEKTAHNGVESYVRTQPGRIETTYRFNDGAFDGPLKEYHPVGFVRGHESNAVWGMRFIWPIKAEYVISWVDPDYTETIIARSRRDYVWIMARDPVIPKARLDALVDRAVDMGYDREAIVPMPQQPLAERAPR